MTTTMNSVTAPVQVAVDPSYRIAQLEALVADVWAVAAACVQEHMAECAFGQAIRREYQDEIEADRLVFQRTADRRRKIVAGIPLDLRMRLEQTS